MNNHFGNDSVPLSTSGLTQHELDQIANIGSCTLSNLAWTNLSTANQPINTNSQFQANKITINGTPGALNTALEVNGGIGLTDVLSFYNGGAFVTVKPNTLTDIRTITIPDKDVNLSNVPKQTVETTSTPQFAQIGVGQAAGTEALEVTGAVSTTTELKLKNNFRVGYASNCFNVSNWTGDNYPLQLYLNGTASTDWRCTNDTLTLQRTNATPLASLSLNSANVSVAGKLSAYAGNPAKRSSFSSKSLGIRAVSAWANKTAATTTAWNSVCWSAELGIFCAVASSGTANRVMTSPDGVTWTSRTTPADNNWTSVCWSSELAMFCAVSSSGTSNRAMTSFDGITWTIRATPTGVDNNWQSVCWAPELGLFCAVASSGTLTRAMTSPDGITWTIRTTPSGSIPGTDNQWKAVCWSPELGLFCAVANSGSNNVMISPDGITWAAKWPNISNIWFSVCWSPELMLFCAVAAITGTGNRVMTSPDGINWTARSSAVDNDWQSVCWSAELSLFCAVSSSGTGNRVMTSPDGFTWTTQPSASDNNWYGVCWSPELGLFCGVSISGPGGFVMTSRKVLDNRNKSTVASLKSNGDVYVGGWVKCPNHINGLVYAWNNTYRSPAYIIYAAQVTQSLTSNTNAVVQFPNGSIYSDPNGFITTGGSPICNFQNTSGSQQNWQVSYTVCMNSSSSTTTTLATWIVVTATVGNTTDKYYAIVNNNTWPCKNSGCTMVVVPAGYYVQIIANQVSASGTQNIGGTTADLYNWITIRTV